MAVAAPAQTGSPTSLETHQRVALDQLSSESLIIIALSLSLSLSSSLCSYQTCSLLLKVFGTPAVQAHIWRSGRRGHSSKSLLKGFFAQIPILNHRMLVPLHTMMGNMKRSSTSSTFGRLRQQGVLKCPGKKTTNLISNLYRILISSKICIPP